MLALTPTFSTQMCPKSFVPLQTLTTFPDQPREGKEIRGGRQPN